jgi:hypothetical protein
MNSTATIKKEKTHATVKNRRERHPGLILLRIRPWRTVRVSRGGRAGWRCPLHHTHMIYSTQLPLLRLFSGRPEHQHPLKSSSARSSLTALYVPRTALAYAAALPKIVHTAFPGDPQTSAQPLALGLLS